MKWLEVGGASWKELPEGLACLPVSGPACKVKPSIDRLHHLTANREALLVLGRQREAGTLFYHVIDISGGKYSSHVLPQISEQNI